MEVQAVLGEGTVGVRYNDGEREEHVAPEQVRRAAPAPEGSSAIAPTPEPEGGAAAQLCVGEQVEARFFGRNKWFKGAVEAVHEDGTFDVLYADGDREKHVAPHLVRRPPAPEPKASAAMDGVARFHEGDKVEARYRGGGRYYPGTVKRVRSDGALDIHYDDGESEQSVSPQLVQRRDRDREQQRSAEGRIAEELAALQRVARAQRRRIGELEAALEEERREIQRAAQTMAQAQAQLLAPPPPSSCVEPAQMEEEDATDCKLKFWRLHVRLQSDLHNQVHEYYRKKNQVYALPAMVFSAVATCLAAYTMVPDSAETSDASQSPAHTASILVALLTVLNTLALGASNFLKFEQRAEAHRMTAKRFAVLENRVVAASFLELPDPELAPLLKQWGEEAVEAAEACTYPLPFWASGETSLKGRAPPTMIDVLDACCPPRWPRGARLPHRATAKVRPEQGAVPDGTLAAASTGAGAGAGAAAQAPGAPGRPSTPAAAAAPAAPAPPSPAVPIAHSARRYREEGECEPYSRAARSRDSRGGSSSGTGSGSGSDSDESARYTRGSRRVQRQAARSRGGGNTDVDDDQVSDDDRRGALSSSKRSRGRDNSRQHRSVGATLSPSPATRTPGKKALLLHSLDHTIN